MTGLSLLVVSVQLFVFLCLTQCVQPQQLEQGFSGEFIGISVSRNHDQEPPYSVLVNAISRRFGTILWDGVIDPIGGSHEFATLGYTDIPTIAAELNKVLERKGNDPLQVILSFAKAKKTSKNERSNLDMVLEMAEIANDIHPGTVTTLLFRNHSSSVVRRLCQVRQARKKLENARHKYSFGFEISSSECPSIRPDRDLQIVQMLKHVDKVFITFDEEVIPTVWRETLLGRINNCNLTVQAVKTELVTIPIISPDTAFPNVSLDIANWGEETQQLVIVNRAFDGYPRTAKNGGWWGFVPGWRPRNLINQVAIFEKHLGWKGWKCTNDESGFNRIIDNSKIYDRLTLYLNEYPSTHDEGLNYDKTMKSLCDTVFSRFRSIVLNVVESRENGEAAMEAIAGYNKERKNRQPVDPDITVTLTSSLEANPVEDFAYLRRLADKANSISPGIVKTILFRDMYQHYMTVYNSSTSTQMESYKRKHSLAAVIYELDCTQTNFDRNRKHFDYLDAVVVYLKSPPELNSKKVEAVVSERLSMFYKCEENLKRAKRSLKVIPALGFSGIERPPDELFWEAWQWMNEWAEVNEEQVGLFNAFDNRDLDVWGWFRWDQEVEEYGNETLRVSHVSEKIEGHFDGYAYMEYCRSLNSECSI